MATAPAALQVSTSLPSSRPSQDRSHSLESPSKPSHPPRKVIRDAEDTPRKEAEGQAISSPTPKGNDASSMSPSRMQTHRTSPLLARNSAQPSSSSLTSLTVDESDSDSRRQTIPLARNSKSSPRNLHQGMYHPLARIYDSHLAYASLPSRAAPSADHNDSDSDEDLPFHSASSNSSRRPTSSKKGKRVIRDSPDSDFEDTLTPRKPSTSPPATRVLRSASKPPTSALPSPSSSTRSATRRQASTSLSESAGAIPRLSLVAATSSAAQHSNEESTSASSDTLRLRPLSPRSSNSNNPTTPRKRGILRSSTHPSPSDTPGGGSRFERAPSGSPLSDLAPSPVKKPRAQSVRSETWRPHSFELIVEVPAARWRTMRAGSIRRERESLTSDFSERHHDEDEAMKEESEDGKSGDQATDEENQKSSRRNPSRSAKRKSPTGARRSLRRRSSSPPPDRKGGKGKSRGASPSSSSSSSEEEDEPEEEEEEEEDVMAALARARDRVAAGQAMLVTSPDVSTSSTAPTTASSMHATQAQDEDHVRRSSRTKHATDHFSPTASSSRAQGDAKDRAKTKAKDESSRGFERLMKEMQAQKQKGRGAGYYQAMKKEIDNEDVSFPFSRTSTPPSELTSFLLCRMISTKILRTLTMKTFQA